MLDLLQKENRESHIIQGPQYLEFRYHFAGTRNLYDYAINHCQFSHNHPALIEIKSHYAISNIFLLGMKGKNFCSLAENWLLSDEFIENRTCFLKRQAGLSYMTDKNLSKNKRVIYTQSGNFQFMYLLFEMGSLKSLISDKYNTPSSIHNIKPCPHGFHIQTLQPLPGYNKCHRSILSVPPGLYYCKAVTGVQDPQGRYYSSLFEFSGEAVNAVVSGSDVFRLCRAGEGLVLAVTLFGLPTYVLDYKRPDWTSDWQALVETLYVSGLKSPKSRAEKLAKKCQNLWDKKKTPHGNTRVSWLFHPDHGIFPDEDLYAQYYG